MIFTSGRRCDVVMYDEVGGYTTVGVDTDGTLETNAETVDMMYTSTGTIGLRPSGSITSTDLEFATQYTRLPNPRNLSWTGRHCPTFLDAFKHIHLKLGHFITEKMLQYQVDSTRKTTRGTLDISKKNKFLTGFWNLLYSII